MYTVYMHVNRINNKKYIGITSLKPQYRWRNGKGYETQVFGRSIAKYGWDSFENHILYTNLNKEQAEYFEVKLINQYNTTNPKYGYNVRFGGDTSRLNESTKEKLRNHNLGKKASIETKMKMRKNHPSTPFIAIDSDGVETEWLHLRECARQLGLNHSSISKCLRGKISTHLGYTFKYNN